MILPSALRALFLTIALAYCDGSRSSTTASTCRRRIGVGAGDVSVALNVRTSVERTIRSDPHTCEFVISGPATVDVSVRPGLGRVTVSSWTSGRMPLTADAVTGVGDSAVWQPQLRELIAEKDDLLCDVTVDVGLWKGSTGSLRDRAGALCTMVFASARTADAAVVRDNSTRR